MDMQRYQALFVTEAREHLGAAFELQLRLEERPEKRPAKRRGTAEEPERETG